MNLKNLFSRKKKVESQKAMDTKRTMPLKLPTDKEKIGWVSPVYNQSRPVKLDSNTLAKNRLVAMIPESPEIDFYKVLRTRIMQRIREHGGKSIMITSALPGEGKTVTAINLAMTFAKEYEHTVLLMDGDLRMQQIHKLLGYESDKGILDHLLADCPVSDLIVWPHIEKLTVLSGGQTIQESSEILTSPRMRELVENMKSRYPERYVFFDVPPVLIGDDVIAFSRLVDWIIVVVRAGQTSVQDVNRALKLLPTEKILGLVLNRPDQSIRNYSSCHGYGQNPRQPS